MASEVTIRGAGIFGLTLAWEMLGRGAAVTVVDPAGPGAGASGGVVGALAPHVPENWDAVKALQFESLIGAQAFWAGVTEAGGVDPGYARTGRLQPLTDDEAVARARARVAGAVAHWQDRASWAVIPAPDGWGPVTPTGLVVHDTLSARLDPGRAMAALVAAIRSRGGAVTEEARDRGTVVWATGAAGLAALSADLGQEVGRAIKGQAAVLRLAVPASPQIYADRLHVVPHGDGTVAVGSTTEREFDEPHATDAGLDDVIARARAAVPALAEAPILRRWAGLRPRSRTRQPVIGAWPGRPGHVVINGGFKIGFGVAAGVARLAADLVLEGAEVPAPFRLEACLPRGGRA